MKKRVVGVFLAAEAALYATFLLLDVTNAAPSVSDLLKYASVVLCFFWCIGKKDPILTFAQGFLLVADLILLFTDCFWAGILAFLTVQLSYRLFMTVRAKRLRFIRLFVFCIIAAFLFIVAANMDAVTTLAALYAAFLLWNVASALRRGGPFFAAGLVLLLLCDFNVALWNLPSPPVPPLLRSFAGTAMWLFYLPSQVFIALTAVGIGKFPPHRS